MGIEPLSNAFDAAYLAVALQGKKTPIKSALLDQRVIAGLGNIYVCEALFAAGGIAQTPCGEGERRPDRAARARDQGGAARGDQSGRLLAARPQADRRRARHVPAQFQSLWPRG
ncbi:MAG: hypothetical protein WDM81_15215 [Rhizomicrobium sp.]